jgi:hypothetical protein
MVKEQSNFLPCTEMTKFFEAKSLANLDRKGERKPYGPPVVRGIARGS